MNEPEIQRVALVTGGAVRLGRAIALGFARAGYDILVHYNASEEPAREVVRLVEAMGRRGAAVQADLSRPGEPRLLLDALTHAFPRLDVLVNGAAGFDATPLLDVDAEAWDRVLALNVRAPHLMVREAAPFLSETRGAVVNLVDLSAFQPWTEYPVHAVSKAALAHLTRVQARALAPRVRVNAVAPGAVLPPDDYPVERLEALRARTPLQALGTPDDVVEAVLFLARAPYITGQVLAVDGGRLLGAPAPPGAEG